MRPQGKRDRPRVGVGVLVCVCVCVCVEGGQGCGIYNGKTRLQGRIVGVSKCISPGEQMISPGAQYHKCDKWFTTCMLVGTIILAQYQYWRPQLINK